MRLSILTFFTTFLLFLCAAAQKSNNYKYFYKFQLDYPNDTSKIIIDTFTNQKEKHYLKIQTKNIQSKPITFLTVILKSKDTTITRITNTQGLLQINLNPTTYEITLSGVGYKNLTTSIIINRQEDYLLDITLAREKSLVWYDINSRKELTEKEIDDIKKCVQNDERNVIKCRKKNEYEVAIEI